MLEKLNLKKTLFIDIETVPFHQNYDELEEDMASLWDHKAKSITRNSIEDEEMIGLNNYHKAGIYAEFGRIICISVGVIYEEGENMKLKLKSFAGDDELLLLTEFLELINRYYKNTEKCFICGHNIKEFDVPYLCRRLLVNGLKLPKIFNLYGKKPWEMHHLVDTMELWRFGDYKSYTSLKLMSKVLNIPTSKDDIDGSQVAKVYYEDMDLNRIITYCQKDVIVVVHLIFRLLGKDLIDNDDITYAE
jgi:3'-5' exonuclease